MCGSTARRVRRPRRGLNATRPRRCVRSAGIPPFMTARDLLRRVGADCAVEVDGNAYSVPWRLIGERVRVTVGVGVGAGAARRPRGRRACRTEGAAWPVDG